VYPPRMILEDSIRGRLTITKEGFPDAVVWNPWVDKAGRLDNLQNRTKVTASGDATLSIGGEVDRIYLNAPETYPLPSPAPPPLTPLPDDVGLKGTLQPEPSPPPATGYRGRADRCQQCSCGFPDHLG
jgi:hypothetical protein